MLDSMSIHDGIRRRVDDNCNDAAADLFFTIIFPDEGSTRLSLETSILYTVFRLNPIARPPLNRKRHTIIVNNQFSRLNNA